MLVLVDDASDPVASSDPEGFEVGYFGWRRFERSGAGQGHVRPVVVVVTLAGRQDPAEVKQVPGIEIVLSGVPMPGMNALMERWVQTCRRELLDRTQGTRPSATRR